ncbi:MFS transporter [Nonomuraea dietziae]|uniref:MFS transporter n=1 Tax=Nonomuraea dietziae TaxID=65515 RepID=UPI0031E07EB2
MRRSLGRRFRWFWAAYAVSTFGTWLAFDAFALIAILALDAGPAEVSVLAAAGLAVGAVVAVPLGPWVEFRRKRPVMIAMDLIRFTALMSVPAAYVLGLAELRSAPGGAVVVGAADIAFTAASGACLKSLVRSEDLLVANGRFEATTWTATALGPPLGTAAIGLMGPVTSVAANAVSFLLSAVGIRAIGGREPRPARTATPPRAPEPATCWRDGGTLLASPALRPLFLQHCPGQRPDHGGLTVARRPSCSATSGSRPGSTASPSAFPASAASSARDWPRPLLARFGQHKVMLTAGTLRACWPLGLAFVHPGPTGLLPRHRRRTRLITCMGVFNPVFATYRLERLPSDRVVRTLSAWSITSKATVAAMTGVWGLLAGLTGPRIAIAIAGLLLMATSLLLPRHDRTPSERQTLA